MNLNLAGGTLSALLALLLALPASAATLTGKVVKVADGDTITVLVGREQCRVRLAGIDTPERGQPYGKAAGRALAALVAGKVVAVDYDKRDRYGRIVGKVWVPGAGCGAPACPPVDAGLSLVASGMAWHFKRYAHEQEPADRATYAACRRIGPSRTSRPVASARGDSAMGVAATETEMMC